MKLIRIISFTLLAIPIAASAGWTTTGDVTSVKSHQGIHIIETTIADATCSGNGKFWWSATSADAKDMLSIALAAFMGRKKVQLFHDTVNTDCIFGAYNKATIISVSH